MDEKKLRDLLQEVTADCHDEEEQFWGIFYTLAEGGLDFPLRAKMLGEPVEVVGLDGGSGGPVVTAPAHRLHGCRVSV